MKSERIKKEIIEINIKKTNKKVFAESELCNKWKKFNCINNLNFYKIIKQF